MRYLLGISGGIDSVVLLDMLVRQAKHELILAHFDHGIRDDSAADERFVRALAARYQLPYVAKREELGSTASEEQARMRRYRFLFEQAAAHDAMLATAHHADDVIETIAINLTRGTGWRGVAVLDNERVARPLLRFTKRQLRDYATVHRLEWVEDSTNASDAYLRNRLRRRINRLLSDDDKQALLKLWRQQKAAKWAIADVAAAYVRPDATYDRGPLIQAEPPVAVELLSTAIAATARRPTRPQLERALLAVKTARAGTTLQVGSGVRLAFTARTYRVHTT